jgi:hypothetical protein
LEEVTAEQEAEKEVAAVEVEMAAVNEVLSI